MRRLRSAIAAFLVLAAAGGLAALALRSYWQRAAGGAPAVRGRAVAERLGCFGCHGPGGESPIANPGAARGRVPKWSGGTWMMFNDRPEDVRGWILDGHPPGREPDGGALIAMPAYREHLSERELEDLVAYVLAVSQFGWPEDRKVAQGRDVAVRFGCFGCHGPEGRGLVANPGSLKGYIPPWEGADYLDLVRSPEEFRQWVREGVCDRLAANPAARFFLERQAIPMPAYGDRLSEEELPALLAYVEWVRANPRGGSAEAR